LTAPTGTDFYAVAVDTSGNIYVCADDTTSTYPNTINEILVSAPGATGAATPIRTIKNIPSASAIAVDTTGQIYTLNDWEISVFAAGATGNAVPIRQIAGSMTGIKYAYSIAVDTGQNIYVANTSASNTVAGNILVFSSTASGNTAPTSVIGGAATEIDAPWGVTVDAAGDILVASMSENGTPGDSKMLEFAPGANGNVAPVKTLTAISQYATSGIAVDAVGNIYDSLITYNTSIVSLVVFSPNESGSTAPAQTISSTAWTGTITGLIAIH
jgi:hypothetical protein